MYHSDWFKLRYELTRDYPNRIFDIGSILNAYEFEGKVKLDKDKSINPRDYKDHFRELKWWEHRTIEQLKTIDYMKVVSNGNYYLPGDIVEVDSMYYSMNNLWFKLGTHEFLASQVKPATKEEYEKFKSK